MSVRDALLLNLTGSNFEALQSNDTARVKGDLSFEKDNETKIVEVDVSQASINVTGRVTGSSNISSSLSSTGSFGHVIATSFHGDGSAIRDTLPRSPGLLSSSAQIADVISGSFFRGFEFSSSISGSATSTGSFGRVEGVEFFGDGSNIKTTLPRSTGILTSSAQIAANISGSFTNGFNIGQSTSSIFTGVSGSTYHFSGSVSGSYFGSDYNRHLADQIGHIRSEGSSGSRDSFELVGGVIDGTWTQLAGGSLNTKRSTAQNSMTGETNAAIIAGSGPGEYDNCTETEIWNGTSWSEVNDYITGRRGTTQIGSVYASVLVGGCQTWTSKKFAEEWNGHSWSAATDLPDISGSIIGFGTQNDAVFMSGQGQGQGSKFYNYNGTNFSTPGVAQEELVLWPGAPSNGTTGQSADGTSNDGIIHYTGGVPATGMFGCAQVNGSTRFWDGLAISRGPDTNTAPTGFYTRGLWGRSNSALLTRGNNTSNTEIFNGISWSEVTNFPAGGGGSQYGHAGTSADSGIKLNTEGGESNLYEWVGQYNTTASFGRLDGGVIRGDATDLHSTLPYNGVVSSSAQIASNISGSFNKGFTFSGAIKAGEATWAQTACLIQERWELGGVGSVNAAIAVGGQCGPHTHHNTSYGLTEQYDGTSFTEVNDMINASTGTAAGQYSNAYFHKYNNGNDTEYWNGTNWAAGHVNPTAAKLYIGGSTPSELYVIGSVSNCGNFFSDYDTGGGTFAVCTAVPFTFGWGAGYFGHSGDMTAGIVSSGWTNPASSGKEMETVIWNGSTWSDSGAQLIPYPNRAGWSNHKQAGTVNASFMVGGASSPPSGPGYGYSTDVHVVNAHQGWDGTSWSVKAEIPQVHSQHAAVGTPQASLFFGGIAHTPTAPTYRLIRSGSFQYEEDMTTGSFGRLEFISASGDATGLQSSITYVTNPAFNVLTGSGQIASQISGSFTRGFEHSGLIGKARGGVFASSTNMLDVHTGGNGGSMLQGTAIVAGGSYGGTWPPQSTDNTQLYDGTSWTEVNNLASGVRSTDAIGLAGDSSAAVFFGGGCTGGETEEWNGTNWTEVADSPETFAGGSTSGGESSESAIFVGYHLTRGNKWDGTAWTETPNMITPRYDASSTGKRDCFLVIGGSSPIGAPTYPAHLCSEVYNGTNWSATADVITKIQGAFGMGTYNDAIFAGGKDFPHSHLACNFSQTFDGTSWAAGPNIVSKRQAESAGSKFSGPAANGATNAAWFGGGSPGFPVYNSSATEVFPAFVVSASFGKLEAGKLFGDASGLHDSLPYPTGVVSASAQLAVNVTASSGIGSYISGSFRHGFDVSGNLSGSATSTGSFGKFIATTLHGDGTSISGSLPRSVGVVSGSVQIASNISGSFIRGFGYDGTISTNPAAGAWSTGGNLNTARHNNNSCTGAGVAAANAVSLFGGAVPGSPYGVTGKTENYDGVSWSESGDLNTARCAGAGFGTQNAGVYAVGYSNTSTPFGGCKHVEEFDGSSWTEVTNFPQNAAHTAAAGTQNAGIVAFGGIAPVAPGYVNDGSPYSVEYNGTNWVNATTDTDFSPYGAQVRFAMAGTQDAAITVGSGKSRAPAGGGAYIDNTVMNYNGTNWSLGTVTPNFVKWTSLSGTQNSVLSAGGYANPPYPAIPSTTAIGDYAQRFDGTSWAQVGNMITRQQAAGASGLTGYEMTMFGGLTTDGSTLTLYSNNTQEYFEPFSQASFHNIEATSLSGDGSQFSASLQSQILTASSQIATSVSGSFNKGFGLQGGVSASFGLHGGTWTEVADLIQGRNSIATVGGAAEGGLSSGQVLAVGGRCGNSVPYGSKCTELWDGEMGTWTEVNDLITCQNGPGMAGSACSAIYHQGYIGGIVNNEFWNGINWSEAADGGHVGYGQVGDGTSEAAIFTGGYNNSHAVQACTTEWDGIVFYTANAMPSVRGSHGQAGSQNAAYAFGGNTPAPSATGIKYDGTNWSTSNDLLGPVIEHAGSGTQNAALSTFGRTPPNIDVTDTFEYNGISWSKTANANRGTTNGQGNRQHGLAGGQQGSLAVGGYSKKAFTEEYKSYGDASSGSFHHLRGTVGGEIRTNMFNITSSTFKLPLFSDADLNYHSQEPQEGTGSMSGSFDRVTDVNVLNKPGNLFFHTDYNALAFTYVSASIYSQSIDFVTCTYQSASLHTASAGFITQSHYCYHNVVQYITGSYT